MLAGRWLHRAAHPASASALPAFRIVSWNHLADGLDISGGFTADPSVLPWSYRAPLVAAYLRSTAPDIVCLHEATDPSVVLRALDGQFSLLYAPKPNSPAFEHGGPCDGTALLVRRERFTIMVAETLHYTDGDGGIANQVALLAELRDDAAAGRRLVVCTTHLKAKAGAALEAVRAGQVAQLLAAAARLRGGRAGVPVILAGDFNSPPSGAVYPLVLADPAGYRSVYNALPRPPPESAGVEGAVAAYAAGEPGFTTWKFREGGGEKKVGGGKVAVAMEAHRGDPLCPHYSQECIDFIWVAGLAEPASGLRLSPLSESALSDSNSLGAACLQLEPPAAGAPALLECRALLEIPSEGDIGTEALPSAAFPSDHLAVGAELVWADSARTRSATLPMMPGPLAVTVTVPVPPSQART